jgi:hypothetical protein
MCDHICDCYYYWSLQGRVHIYIRILFLYLNRLLDIVGYDVFSPTMWLLVWLRSSVPILCKILMYLYVTLFDVNSTKKHSLCVFRIIISTLPFIYIHYSHYQSK